VRERGRERGTRMKIVDFKAGQAHIIAQTKIKEKQTFSLYLWVCRGSVESMFYAAEIG
jgi:hypothetical protein